VEEERPSRSALRVALRRAAHQIYDSQPLVFEDSLAVKILGTEFADELRKTETKLHKVFSLALRAFLVARSRYAEDCLARAFSAGVRQYCLLGAGLDTFGYRNPHDGLRVFEVDHPATQRWKRGLLQLNRIDIPDSLSFVPIDFQRDDLAMQLESGGFDTTAPAFFGWMGVVPYLTLDAFRGTIEFIAQRPTRSGLVMDYGQPREALEPREQLAHDSLASRVARGGEPFRLFFFSEEILAELKSFGQIEDLGWGELNGRYFAGRSDDLRVRGTGARVISAWVR